MKTKTIIVSDPDERAVVAAKFRADAKEAVEARERERASEAKEEGGAR